jgi:hypothetical protein
MYAGESKNVTLGKEHSRGVIESLVEPLVHPGVLSSVESG